MRAHDFIFERTGLTKGDIAETFFGAAMAAAFLNYPRQADEATMLSIAKQLTPKTGMSYSVNNAGKPADTIQVKNVIKNQLHLNAFSPNEFNNTVEFIRHNFPSVLAAANGELKAIDSKISAKKILENGIADLVVISAIGGEDQSTTKVDVKIVHSNPEMIGAATADTTLPDEITQSYSLKYDEGGKLIPVGQNPAVVKNTTYNKDGTIKSRDQITFWNDIGVTIDKNSIRDDLDKVNASIKTKKYQSEKDTDLIKKRRESDAFKETVFHMKNAADQINQNINTNRQEALFLTNLENFLKIHVSKGDDLKVLGITRGSGYKIGHLNNIRKNVDKINLHAITTVKAGSPPNLRVMNTFKDNEEIVFEIRLATAGGNWKKSNRSGKIEYRTVRYTLKISIGPGFNRITTLDR